jgi:hypothetical protein
MNFRDDNAAVGDAIQDPHLALALIKVIVNLLSAMIDLGVPIEQAQALLADVRSAALMVGDACVLVEQGETTAHAAIGWHDGRPLLSDSQLTAATDHGSALDQNSSGLALFQRLDIDSGELHVLGECIDAVAFGIDAVSPAVQDGRDQRSS